MSEKTYSNEGKLTLFPNDKGGNEKRPDYRGTFTLNGVDYKVSLWERTSQNGGKRYISGPIEAAQAKPDECLPPLPKPRPAPMPAPTPAPKQQTETTEDIPF
jgi:hypothetical protein